MRLIFQIISSTEIAKIQDASLTILNEIDMCLPLQEVQETFKEAGCTIEGEIVKIPAAVVYQALETTPKRDRVTLYGREPQIDISFTTRDPALACMTMATNVIDPHINLKRSATTQDLVNLVSVADQLDFTLVNCGLITPQEVPGKVNDWYTWAGCKKTV